MNDLDNNLNGPDIDSAEQISKMASDLTENLNARIENKATGAQFTSLFQNSIQADGGFNNKEKQGVLRESHSTNINAAENPDSGYYNSKQDVSTDNVGATVANRFTVDNIKNSDAYKGYSKINHALGYVSTGVTGKATSEAIIKNNLSIHRPSSLTTKDGQVISMSKSSDILNVYKSDMESVNKVLNSYNINAQNLNTREINKALKYKKLGKIDLAKNPDADKIVAALEYKERLLKQKNYAQDIESSRGIGGVASQFASDTLSDSDAYKGFQTVRTAKNVGKVTVGVTGAAAQGAVLGVTGANLLTKKGAEAFTSAQLRGVQKKIDKLTEKDVKIPEGSKIATRQKKLTEKVKKQQANLENARKIHVDTTNRISKIRSFSPTEKVKGFFHQISPFRLAKVNTKRAIAKVSLLMDKNPITRVLSKATGKVVKGATKVVKAPFIALKKLNVFLRKVYIILGLAILIIMLVCALLIVVFSYFSTKDSKDSDSPSYYLEKTIDDVYKKQNAYEKNIWACSLEDTETANYGIPSENWYLKEIEEIGVDALPYEEYAKNPDAMDDERVTKKIGTEIKGYDLEKYWGNEEFRYKTEYYPDIEVGRETVTNDEGETYTVPIWGKSDTPVEVCLIGEAGIYGRVNGGQIFELGTLESGYIIPKDDNVYQKRNEDYAEVEKVYKYQGCEIVEFNNYETEYADAMKNVNKYKFGYTNNEGVFASSSIDIDLEKQESIGGWTYSQDAFYKGLCGLTLAVNENAEDSLDFYKYYFDFIFEQVMKSAILDYQVRYELGSAHKDEYLSAYIRDPNSGSTYEVKFDRVSVTHALTVYYSKSGLLDMATLDPSTKETLVSEMGSKRSHTYADYIWEQWHITENNKDVNSTTREIGNMTLPYEFAVEVYGYDKETFEEFYEGVWLPSSRFAMLSEKQIKEILDSLENLTDEQAEIIKKALEIIGTYAYQYGVTDCSAFISQVLRECGYLGEGERLTCSGFLGKFNEQKWNGDWAGLAPGTLIIKNSAAGTATGSDNHIVMFMGFDKNGNPMVIENTTTKNGSGPQITSGSDYGEFKENGKRIDYISGNYQYIIPPSAFM